MTKNSNAPVRLSIKEAVVLSGLSENYIRKAISKGGLPVTKEFKGDTQIPKNWIDADAFEAWRAAASSHTKREDGRNKYVVYMTAEEEVELKQLIADMEFVGTLVRANHKVIVESE
jgi:hypothetical protein